MGRNVSCLAAKVTGILKLALDAGKANPSPPVGPALGARGINIMAFCKEYNAKTANKIGSIIPVEITLYEDKSFSIKLKTSPVSILIKKASGINVFAHPMIFRMCGFYIFIFDKLFSFQRS